MTGKVVDTSNYASVELVGLPQITVHRVYRAEGWVRRFDVGPVRGVTPTIITGVLADEGYTVDQARVTVDAMSALVFGPEDDTDPKEGTPCEPV